MENKKTGQIMVTAGFFCLIAGVLIWGYSASQEITTDTVQTGWLGEIITNKGHTWSQEFPSLFNGSTSLIGTVIYYASILTIVIGFIKIFSNSSIKTKKCPSCAETINIEAIKCRFCGQALDPVDVHRKNEMISSIVPTTGGSHIKGKYIQLSLLQKS
jgi:hypothetical protein